METIVTCESRTVFHDTLVLSACLSHPPIMPIEINYGRRPRPVKRKPHTGLDHSRTGGTTIDSGLWRERDERERERAVAGPADRLNRLPINNVCRVRSYRPNISGTAFNACRPICFFRDVKTRIEYVIWNVNRLMF